MLRKPKEKKKRKEKKFLSFTVPESKHNLNLPAKNNCSALSLSLSSLLPFYAVPTSPTSVIPKMDTDMDIPLPDELEWLEANSHLHDDYPDFDDPSLPYPQDEDEQEFQPQSNNQNHQQLQPPKPTLSIPPKTTPTAKTQIKKRFRSDGQDSLVTEEGARSEDKRKRGDDVRLENEEGEGEGAEEDWLRYSPPPMGTEEGGGVVEEDVVVEVEKVVSRFASEIDGDFVPVTGLDGERVYAKMSSRVEEINGLKKVGIKVHTGGMIYSYLIKFFGNDIQ